LFFNGLFLEGDVDIERCIVS